MTYKHNEIITTVSLVNIYHLTYTQLKKYNKGSFFPWELLGFILIYNINYFYHIIHYISSIYFITGSLYLLTTFIQFLLQLSPASSNYKSGLFFSEYVCLFIFEVQLTYSTVLVPFTQHRDSIFLYILKRLQW